ncbi:MAG: hypothetical protein AB1445_07245 [Bacillota bacterium]
MPLRTLSGHTDGVVGLSQDQDFVYSGSKDLTVRIWSSRCVSVLPGFPAG